MVGLPSGPDSWPAPGAGTMTYHVPVHATKASELAEQINAITYADEANDLALRRIERNAHKLMAADPVGAHTVLGEVAVLRGRVDDVRRHHGIALQQSGHSAQACRNYSVSLMNLGEMIEAFEAAREAFRRAPDDGDVLRHLIRVALESAHFREARDHCGRWNTLFPGSPSPHEPSARALAGAVERDVFREESVREVLKIAHDIRRAAKVVLVDMTVLVDGSGPDSFLYKLRIPLSPARAADLNERLADRITNRQDLMADPGMKFVPMFIGARIDVGDSERTV